MTTYNVSKEFLYSVMRDVSAPIMDRITAAGHLLQIELYGPERPTVICSVAPRKHSHFASSGGRA
jgi:hypothetical protein